MNANSANDSTKNHVRLRRRNDKIEKLKKKLFF